MSAHTTLHHRRWELLAITTAILALGVSLPAFAFTATQATNIWNAYNSTFYVGNNGDAYYNWEQGGSLDSNNFWENAEMIEMAVDRAQRSGSSGDKAIVTALINGFDKTYGSDWTGDIYNDDIMWACIAHLRAYFVTGSTNSSWAVEAANNFNWVYNGGHSPGRVQAQVDSTYGGGMWWSTDHGTDSNANKPACANGPAAIAAYYLSVVYPTGTGFLSQSKALYNWEKGTLVTSAGYVYNQIGPGSTGANGYDLSYNAGTCLGAAYLLGDSTTAGNVASYYMNDECSNLILPNWGTGGGNNDGFNGIFLRWMALYMLGSGTEATYGTFLYENAAVAISVENSAGVAWDNWTAATPSSGLYSWDCSPAVVALNALPPNPLAAGTYSLTPACATGSALDDTSGSTTNGTKLQIWQVAHDSNQNWTFASIGTNEWNAAVNGPYCLTAGGTTSGSAAEISSCNGSSSQAFVSSAVGGGYNFALNGYALCLDVSDAGSANGTAVQIYTCNGTNAQNWAIN